jgi:predicted dehydrogenase
MDKVRIGIVGMGNMGKYHADYLLKDEVAHAELAAVCSTSPHKLEAYKDKVKVFSDGEAMIKSGEIDAVLVATPHYQHTSLGICAIEHQVHLTDRCGRKTSSDCLRSHVPTPHRTSLSET